MEKVIQQLARGQHSMEAVVAALSAADGEISIRRIRYRARRREGAERPPINVIIRWRPRGRQKWIRIWAGREGA